MYKRQPAADANVGALPDARRAFDADEAARADAIHDLDLDIFDVEQAELELGEPEAIDAMNADGVEVSSLDEEPLRDEPYDAVDPESLGNEFLRRAVDAPSTDAPPASLFDTSGDSALELPVGRVESDGTVELHEPRYSKEKATDLSPNDEELAQRASESPGEPSGKPNG